ncbi:TPA: AAA family ATPase [Escherichia coli]|nr:AAA family ATPase [Escherichia coli]
MAVLGLQGVRGGVGTTTITAALAWSLQMLGENVLVVDASPDNLLRLSFNVDFTHRQGWARAMLDGQDWRDAGLRYTSQLDLLPMLIHRDEAMAECLAAKQPVGEYRSDALAAEEILTLANWCLLNYSGLKTPVGSAS